MTIVECPRDAMQGILEFIPTTEKIRYLNQLLKVGFDVLDFGSFVSPKAIPQLSDTDAVLAQLELGATRTKLLAIVANERGADAAASFEAVSCIGYPFSISETFQLRNTNATIEASLTRLETIQNTCVNSRKQLVVYLSMAFGNPYGDTWSNEIAAAWCERLVRDFDLEVIALSDTIGAATAESAAELFKTVIPAAAQCQIGAHLHTKPEKAAAVVSAVYEAGCRRFDAALNGIGGCPMADDVLVGNVATQQLLAALPVASEKLDSDALYEAIEMADFLFSRYH